MVNLLLLLSQQLIKGDNSNHKIESFLNIEPNLTLIFIDHPINYNNKKIWTWAWLRYKKWLLSKKLLDFMIELEKHCGSQYYIRAIIKYIKIFIKYNKIWQFSYDESR